MDPIRDNGYFHPSGTSAFHGSNQFRATATQKPGQTMRKLLKMRPEDEDNGKTRGKSKTENQRTMTIYIKLTIPQVVELPGYRCLPLLFLTWGITDICILAWARCYSARYFIITVTFLPISFYLSKDNDRAAMKHKCRQSWRGYFTCLATRQE